MWTPETPPAAPNVKPGLNLGLFTGGLAGIASQILGNWMNNRNQDKTNRANRELAEYSYGKDLEMWNRMNEYNLPASQMSRLREAGLNPNLVYGSGAKTEAATMPKYNAPTMAYNYKPILDPLATLDAFQDFQMKNAQINNMKAQAEIAELESQYRKTYLFQRNYMQNSDLKIKETKANEALIRDMFYNQGGLGFWESSRYREGFESDLAFRKGRLGQQRSQINALDASARLRNMEANLYDWNIWSRILQGFGIKLPSLGRYTRSAGKAPRPTISARPSRGSSRTVKNGNVTQTTWQKD